MGGIDSLTKIGQHAYVMAYCVILWYSATGYMWYFGLSTFPKHISRKYHFRINRQKQIGKYTYPLLSISTLSHSDILIEFVVPYLRPFLILIMMPPKRCVGQTIIVLLKNHAKRGYTESLKFIENQEEQRKTKKN